MGKCMPKKIKNPLTGPGRRLWIAERDEHGRALWHCETLVSYLGHGKQSAFQIHAAWWPAVQLLCSVNLHGDWSLHRVWMQHREAAAHKLCRFGSAHIPTCMDRADRPEAERPSPT